MEVAAVPAPRTRARFSLRWKAFGLIVVVLGGALSLLTALGYRNLQEQQAAKMEDRFRNFPIVLETLLNSSAERLEQLARQLAAPLDIRAIEAATPDEAIVGVDSLAELDMVALIGLDDRRLLKRWDRDWPDAPTEQPWLHQAVEQVRVQRRPQLRIVCQRSCTQYALVPALDRRQQGVIVVIGRALSDLLLSFHQLTGAQLGLLLPPHEAPGPPRPAVLGFSLLAVGDAAHFAPLLAAAGPAPAHPPGPAAPLRRAAQDRVLRLVLADLPGTTVGLPAQALFVVDETAAEQAIRDSVRRLLLAAIAGLLATVGAVVALVAPPMRRLTRITHALPLLATRDYAATGRELARSRRRTRLPDEIDLLGDTAHWLTQRLQTLDAAEAASESKSRFLAAMSHEIRTPMNGVLGMLELLEQSPLDARQQEQVGVVRESGQALLRVIDDILDFSKIEAGRLEIERVPFSLVDVLEGAVDTVAPGLHERPVRLLSEVDPALPPRLLGDPLRLRQVLLNLAGNAIKFTEAGRVRVRAQRVAADPGEIAVRFEVSDTGIGIAPEAQRSLFQPFFQAESSTSRRYGGSGLGLSICSGLVERMGGRLQVESAPGRGSRFWFQLAFSPAAADPPAPPPLLAGLRVVCALDDDQEAVLIARSLRSAGADCGPGDGGTALRVEEAPEGGRRAGLCLVGADGRRQRLERPYRRDKLIQTLAALAGVEPATPTPAPPAAPPAAAVTCGATPVLVAEDHPVNRRLLCSQLERLGYAVELVEDGAAAWQRLQTGSYAALVTDIQMPHLDGYALAARQRQREARGEVPGRLPIIALSARALQGELQRCVAAGMDDYLAKPVLLSELQARLARWIPVSAPSPAAAPTDAGAAGPAPVDLGLLRDCLGDDEAAIAGLLAEFLRINTPLIAELQERARNGSASELQALAHRLLGSARTAGAERLATAIQALETEATAPREHRERLGAAVAGEFAQLRDWIERSDKVAVRPERVEGWTATR